MTLISVWKSLTATIRSRTTGKQLFWIASFAVLVYFIRAKVTCAKYPFIKDKNTIRYFNKSKTIVIENNLNLKKDIEYIYKGAASFCSATDISNLTREVKQQCAAGRTVVVITVDVCRESDECFKELCAPFPAIAEQFKYTLLIASPKQQIIPLYTGWLLNEDDSGDLLSVGKKTLEELLLKIPSFFDSFKNFTKQDSVKEMVNYYKLAASNANGMLHCTAKYLANGTARGSIEYWSNREIKNNLSRCYGLNVIGFVWTPRTFGARVKLTNEELRLWDNIDETMSKLGPQVEPNFVDPVREGSEPDFAPVKGRGSRAHLTLGVAEDVPAVVTGQDLSEVVKFESEHRNWTTYFSSLGWLRDYGDGVWVLYSAEKYLVESMFGGVYSR